MGDKEKVWSSINRRGGRSKGVGWIVGKGEKNGKEEERYSQKEEKKYLEKSSSHVVVERKVTESERLSLNISCDPNVLHHPGRLNQSFNSLIFLI